LNFLSGLLAEEKSAAGAGDCGLDMLDDQVWCSRFLEVVEREKLRYLVKSFRDVVELLGVRYLVRRRGRHRKYITTNRLERGRRGYQLHMTFKPS
jgi:hypothetical protein